MAIVVPTTHLVASGSALSLPDVDLAGAGRRGAVGGVEGWASDAAGIGARFRADAFARLRLSRRSGKYRKEQLARLGQELPYVSPRNMINKFRDLVRIAGIGHRVISSQTANGGEAVLTVAASRGLNFARRNGRYLEEWATLAPVEADDITARVEAATVVELDRALDAGSSPHG